jgi:selenide,water dikinase
MRLVNRDAARLLRRIEAFGFEVGAVTDVTGFGLAGHGWEVANHSEVEVHIWADRIPTYPGVNELARAGIRTGAEDRIRDYVGSNFESAAALEYQSIVLDPQTSGGLLATVPPGALKHLSPAFQHVGEIRRGSPRIILC